MRKNNGSYQYIAILVQNIGGENRVEPFAQIGLEQSSLIYQQFLGGGSPVDVQVPYRYFTKQFSSYEVCQNEEDVSQLLAWLDRFVREKLLPCVEEYSNPQKILDAYINHDEKDRHSCDVLDFAGYSSALTGLIFAKYYGSTQQYEDLKRRYMPLIEPLTPEIKSKAISLIAYLDQV